MCSGDSDVGECPLGKVDVSGDVLANDGLGVVAGHVVPLDPVPVKVVQHSQARLRVTCEKEIKDHDYEMKRGGSGGLFPPRASNMHTPLNVCFKSLPLSP